MKSKFKRKLLSDAVIFFNLALKVFYFFNSLNTISFENIVGHKKHCISVTNVFEFLFLNLYATIIVLT